DEAPATACRGCHRLPYAPSVSADARDGAAPRGPVRRPFGAPFGAGDASDEVFAGTLREKGVHGAYVPGKAGQTARRDGGQFAVLKPLSARPSVASFAGPHPIGARDQNRATLVTPTASMPGATTILR